MGLATITPAAVSKVQEYMKKELDPNLNLRVFVVGGGCHGLEYGFTFENEVLPDDQTFDSDGFKLVIDNISFLYLNGSTIDYVDDFSGARFSVENAQASTSCNCGSSSSFGV